MSEVLKISNLSKSFGKKRVLFNFDMTLEKGKIYGLLGKNGTGKTTLIRTIMGIIRSDQGEVSYKGHKICFNSSNYKKEIGYIPEDPFFYSWMTVGNFLAFNASFHPTWDKTSAADYLDKFSLNRKERIRNLSRGMKLKLGLIAALSHKPELLIFDDPTSGLDVPTRQTFLKDIISEFAERGTTILFASHMVHELDGIIDHLMILDKGKLIIDEKYADFKKTIKKLVIGFKKTVPEKFAIKNIIQKNISQNQAELVIYPWNPKILQKIHDRSALDIREEVLSLEEIFTCFVT